MLGSMYSAVSGLSAHQTKMNVIGNNIANVNTYGFKSSRVTFSDVFYQTLRVTSAPTSNSGGINPNQLGYGVRVSSIDVINTRAGSATTDRALDVYINGDGYLPVKNSDGVVKFTRVGVLGFDEAGNMVDSNGNMVLGIPLDNTTKICQLDANGMTSAQKLVPIKISKEDLDKYTGISIGETGEVTGIREGDPILTKGVGTGWLADVSLPATSLYNGTVTMTTVRSPEVVMLPGTYDDGTTISGVTLPENADVNGSLKLLYDSATSEYSLSYRKLGDTVDTVVQGVVAADTATFAVGANGGGTVNITLPVGGAGAITVPATGTLTLGTVTAKNLDISLSTYDKSGAEVKLQLDDWAITSPEDTFTLGDFTFTVNAAELGSAANKTGAEIGRVGPGAGTTEKIANLAAVRFTNPDALSQSGEGYYLETTNSGSAEATIPGSMGTGSFRAGSLEMSNVDLSKEFTEMIIAQRGFQANTRMITVSDEMLSELVNMKR